MVCERWSDFENFLSDMGEKPFGMSLDRIDNNGHYEPANCRWATNSQQARNKRNNFLITIDGVSKTLAGWQDTHGVHPMTIRDRLSKGWEPCRAVSVPATSKGGYGSKRLRQS